MSISAYIRNTWVNVGSPALSATNLNKIETQVDAITDEFVDELIRPATTKATIVDSDEVGGNDSADSFKWKKWTWATVKAWVLGFGGQSVDGTRYATKKLTGTTAAAEGGFTSVFHGLTGDKIIGWTTKIVFNGNSGIASVSSSAVSGLEGYEYYTFHDPTQFSVYLHPTNSENILSKQFFAWITYEL